MRCRRCLPLLSRAWGASGGVSRRGYVGQGLAANLPGHLGALTACGSPSALLYSPLGTAMLGLLAYNVVVVGGKHVFYVLELTARDYVQDPALYIIVRYGVLISILLGMEALFVEA